MAGAKTILGGALLVLAALLAGGVRADPIAITLKEGEDRSLDLGGAALRVKNLSGGLAELIAEFAPGPPGNKNAGPFVLLDGTLSVSSSIPSGDGRFGIRIGYARAALERLGLRERTLRILRFDGRAGAWGRATLRDGRALQRRAFQRRDFKLGLAGFSASDGYVWAVTDKTSLFAVGALPVPEPAGILLLGLGLGGLLLARRRRRS